MDRINDIQLQSIKIQLNSCHYKGHDIDAIYLALHDNFMELEITYRWEPAAVAPDLMTIAIEISENFNTLVESIICLGVITKFTISTFKKVKKALGRRQQKNMLSRESEVQIILKDFNMEIQFDTLNKLRSNQETNNIIHEAIKNKKREAIIPNVGTIYLYYPH